MAMDPSCYWRSGWPGGVPRSPPGPERGRRRALHRDFPLHVKREPIENAGTHAKQFWNGVPQHVSSSLPVRQIPVRCIDPSPSLGGRESCGRPGATALNKLSA
jgi:hypothetical protein